MYVFKNHKNAKTIKELETTGYLMPSKRNSFKIQGEMITNICIIDPILAHPVVSKKVTKKYLKLVELLTELLISDDDTGETFHEALTQIERFRQEIKNKYRKYLTKKELEKMSKQLKIFQLEAKTRFIELQNALAEINLENERGKGR